MPLINSMTFWSRFSKDKQEAFNKAVLYIEMLASSTSVDVSKWDIVAIFGTGTGKEIETDKIEINKRFFAHLKKVLADAPLQEILIDEELSSAISGVIAKQKESLLSNAKFSTDIANQHIASHLKQIRGHQETIAHNYMVHQSVSSGDFITERMDALKRIWNNKFYSFHSIDGDGVLFTTRDVILSKKHAKSGVDISVDLGKFIVRASLHYLEMRVYPFENNYGVSRTNGHDIPNPYHPFIGRDGTICMGEASKEWAKYIERWQVDKAFDLLSVLLTTYAEDCNPYRSIEDFHRLFTEKGPPTNRWWDATKSPKQPPQPDDFIPRFATAIANDLRAMHFTTRSVADYRPLPIQYTTVLDSPEMR